MDFTFYGNGWNASSSPRYGQSFRQVLPKATTPPPQFVKPKVVSIPVQFVGSKRSRSDPSRSAVKIQKVFRGFFVRKSLKKIEATMEEVKDIERRVSNKETVDLIRNDSKERLKVNDMLMSLLFKLDSVRGVDFGVRDRRKSVIKKVIALQELVDGIVSGEQSLDSYNVVAVAEDETIDQNQRTNYSIENPEPQTHAVDQNQGINDSSDNCNPTPEPQTHAVDQNQGINDSSDNCNPTPEPQTYDEIINDAELMPNSSESEVILQNQETVESNKETGASKQEDDQEDGMETSQTESKTDSSANPENLAVEEGESKGEEAAWDENGTCPSDDEKEENNSSNNLDSGENERRKELLERMMEDNEKMMGMMAELFQRNEQQTRLLSALSQRVEQLEKAFLCDKLRRKKKRSADSSVDCVEKSPDVKKCGKR